MNKPLNIRSFPKAILHIDGDAFFASCEQSRDLKLRGRPVVTGKERGIASSLSYEAKARGVVRGMSLYEIKKICPDVIIMPSDYETYSILSKRFFDIVRRYTSDVEEYGIDECFADITGLRRSLRMSYPEIAEKIKSDLDSELGFTFSIGLGPNKVISKVGSKWKKPSGLTIIPAREAHLFLEKLPVEKIWGIGIQTTAYLSKFGITTALQFARCSEQWVESKMSKPFFEIWQELNGKFVLSLETKSKEKYVSIQKVKTFTPPSNDREFVFSQLAKNIENACMKARRYSLSTKEVTFFLRTQDFGHAGGEIKFSDITNIPTEIIELIRPLFDQVFEGCYSYRATGIVLGKLSEMKNRQLDIFGKALQSEKMSRVFEGVDKMRMKYGKHTIFLGTSFQAHKFSQHEGDRGDDALRKIKLLPGETARKRLGIPMFLGEVV